QRGTHTVELYAAAMAPMLSGFAAASDVPRRKSPRTNVQAGAIMVAGGRIVIQPFPGPTGWQVIGWTELPVVDITAEDPATFKIGDRVVFSELDAPVPTKYAL